MAPQQNWSSTEDIALFRAMVKTVLSSRTDLYATPELSAWSNNGGSKINDKMKQLLKKFGSVIPGAQGIVEEEIVAMGKKRTSTKSRGSGKKRKMEVKGEDEEDW